MSDWGRPGWRASLAERIDQDWDLIIVGAGITGAGVFREAARRGLRTLLVEQNDFASGTSARSSKLVHGGLRYLGTREWPLTVHSVREREHLLEQAAGLVERQGFLLPVRRDQRPGWWTFRAGLKIYDRIARQRLSRVLHWSELRELAPNLSVEGLRGALYMEDARTDDTRMVMRLIHEGIGHGGVAVNYLRLDELRREAGRVCAMTWSDRISGDSGLSRADCIVNATGAWAGRHGGSAAPRMRPLRGSHLLFDRRRFPLPIALSWLHPRDRRPVFAYEWEGASLVGTTDLDHAGELDQEPRVSAEEVAYLLEAVAAVCPRHKLQQQDIIACYAGVRPVVSSGAQRPSDESRDTALWREPGIVHVTGGKLTTFRLTALDVLAAVADDGGLALEFRRDDPIFDQPAWPDKPRGLSGPQWRRLTGRHGAAVGGVVQAAENCQFETIGDSPIHWAELVHAARTEAVEHLDDLLLRRCRLGLVTPDGARAWLPRIRELCQSELNWSDARWQEEQAGWLANWQANCSPAG